MNSEASSPDYLKPTLSMAARIWWAWFWRWGLIFLVGIFVILHVPSMGLAIMLGGTRRITEAVGVVLGLTWMVGAQVYAVWNLFPKTFRGFELQLEAVSDPPAERPVFVDPTLKQTLSIWWAWFWRQVVWGWPIGFVAASVTAAVLSVAGASQSVIGIVAQGEAIVINGITAILVLPRVLRKDFRRHRIRLVRIGAESPMAEARGRGGLVLR